MSEAAQTEGTSAPAEQPAVQPTAPGAEGAPTPDLSEQIASLGQRFDSFEERLPAQQEQPADAGLSEADLYAALTEEPGEYEDDRGYDEPGDPAQQTQADDPEAQARAVLDQYVSERVADQMGQIQAQVDSRFRQADLAALAQKYPELLQKETLDAVRDTLAPYAERYGNQGLMTDPGFVEMALKANRVSAAAASETPATEARGQGAHIESGAGAGQTDPGVSEEQQIINDILGAGGQKSVFAG